MRIFTKLIVVGVVFFSLLVSCDEEEDICNCYLPCGDAVIVNANLYGQDPSSMFSVIEAEITGDCLFLTVSSSGCDGNNWGADLFSTEPQVASVVTADVRMDLINQEACLAVISKDFMFDLQLLQVAGENSVLINLDGWDETLVYNY